MKCFSYKIFSLKNNAVYSTSYLWDFGDGTTSANKDVVHTYASQVKNKNN